MTTTEAAPLLPCSPAVPSSQTHPAGPPAAPPGLLARVRAQGLTAPAAVTVAAAITAVGAAVDGAGDPSLGTGTGVAVVLAALVATGVVRFRSLVTAALLPPLLVAAAALGLALLGGQNEGSRELVLDVGTTLALSAPLIFGATAAGLGVVLVRVVQHLYKRRR